MAGPVTATRQVIPIAVGWADVCRPPVARAWRHPATGRSGRLCVRLEHAELVSFRVDQHDPCHVTLSDIGADRAESLQPIDFRSLVLGTKVEMQAILRHLRLVEVNEEQPRYLIH